MLCGDALNEDDRNFTLAVQYEIFITSYKVGREFVVKVLVMCGVCHI